MLRRKAWVTTAVADASTNVGYQGLYLLISFLLNQSSPVFETATNFVVFSKHQLMHDPGALHICLLIIKSHLLILPERQHVKFFIRIFSSKFIFFHPRYMPNLMSYYIIYYLKFCVLCFPVLKSDTHSTDPLIFVLGLIILTKSIPKKKVWLSHSAIQLWCWILFNRNHIRTPTYVFQLNKFFCWKLMGFNTKYFRRPIKLCRKRELPVIFSSNYFLHFCCGELGFPMM